MQVTLINIWHHWNHWIQSRERIKRAACYCFQRCTEQKTVLGFRVRLHFRAYAARMQQGATLRRSVIYSVHVQQSSHTCNRKKIGRICLRRNADEQLSRSMDPKTLRKTKIVMIGMCSGVQLLWSIWGTVHVDRTHCRTSPSMRILHWFEYRFLLISSSKRKDIIPAGDQEIHT